MPEYDAFGREIGDDPLAALRDATAPPKPERAPEAVVAEPVPAPEAVMAEPAPVAEPPTFVRPRRRRGGIAGLGVIVALLGLLLAVGNVAVNEIEGGLEDLAEIEEPAGLGPSSMIRQANLEAALEQLRGSGLGRPLILRVHPGRVDARLVAGNGRQSLVRVTAQHELRTLGTRQGRGRGIGYGQIDPAMPERLVRADGRPVRFVRLDRSGWRAFFRDD
ncbi:MAG TPA: hypothetical protein VH741_11885 [Candidatus Limnocylindrales bacterium]